MIAACVAWISACGHACMWCRMFLMVHSRMFPSRPGMAMSCARMGDLESLCRDAHGGVPRDARPRASRGRTRGEHLSAIARRTQIITHHDATVEMCAREQRLVRDVCACARSLVSGTSLAGGGALLNSRMLLGGGAQPPQHEQLTSRGVLNPPSANN